MPFHTGDHKVIKGSGYIYIVTEMANSNIDEDLFSAIARGDVTEVARLIDAGAQIEQEQIKYPR